MTATPARTRLDAYIASLQRAANQPQCDTRVADDADRRTELMDAVVAEGLAVADIREDEYRRLTADA